MEQDYQHSQRSLHPDTHVSTMWKPEGYAYGDIGRVGSPDLDRTSNDSSRVGGKHLVQNRLCPASDLRVRSRGLIARSNRLMVTSSH